MEFNEQLILVRAVYNKLRSEYYSSDFRKKLVIVSSYNPQWYKKQVDILISITSVIENSLLRGNPSRSARYLVLMKCHMKVIFNQVEKDLNVVLC
ncbi:MAG: hypothetical protein ACI4KB_04610 [Oscillospiraceae bacterium]